MIGRVVSTKMKNTAAVLIERTAKHPLYKKTFIRTKQYLADDSLNVKEGDMVEIIKVKPISKMKHWKIVKVIGKNLAEIAEQQMKEKAEEIIAEVMPEEKTEEPPVVSPQIEEKTDGKEKKPRKKKGQSDS